jgi:uncharacterized RDD family membrane protein YckC
MNPFACFWGRTKAFVWDYLILAVYIAVIIAVYALFPVPEWIFENRIFAQVAGVLLITLPVTLYFAFFESSEKQATFGKQRLSLKVIDGNENRISFVKALMRNLLKFLPWEISHTVIWQITFFPETNPIMINLGFGLVYLLIGLNIASTLMTKTRQTLYDLITKTFVVKNI